jgi:hypothetical protein
VSDPQARDLLEAGRDLLRRSLESHGLTVQSLEVVAGSPQDGQPAGTGQDMDGRGERFDQSAMSRDASGESSGSGGGRERELSGSGGGVGSGESGGAGRAEVDRAEPVAASVRNVIGPGAIDAVV